MRWKPIFKFQIKQIMKSKVYISATLGFLILIWFRIFSYLNTWGNLEEFAQLAGEVIVCVQMISIFYLIFFYMLFSDELVYGVQDFFVDGYKIILEKIITSFAAHLLIQFFLLITTYFSFLIVFHSVGIEVSSFFLSLFYFFIIYMLVPIMLTILFAFCVALIFKKRKISFFVLLLIWIFTGSLNQEIFYPFFSQIHANEWRTLLTIGPNSIYSVYRSYLGFNVHTGIILNILMWFFILLTLLSLALFHLTKIKKDKNRTFIALILFFSISLLSGYGAVEESSRFYNTADQSYEVELYKNMPDTENNLHYSIDTYWIEWDRENLEVAIEIESIDTKTPTFQLYYAYPIHSITADGEEIEFQRTGDVVKLNLPTETISNLTFHYSLVDTYLIPNVGGRMMLLANHAWYPKKSSQHIYSVNADSDWIEISDSLYNDETYNFYLNAPGILFTNLSPVEEGYYGETQALTVIKGEGNNLAWDGYDITYPADWPNMDERIKEVLPEWELILNEIKQFAPTKIEHIPENIIFSSTGYPSFLTADHLFYEKRSTTAINDFNSTKDFERNLIRLSVIKKEPLTLYEEWINMGSQFLRNKRDLPIEMQGPTIDIQHSSEEDQFAVGSIYANFNTLTTEQKRHFLHEWYEQMNEEWEWEDVSQLIKEMK